MLAAVAHHAQTDTAEATSAQKHLPCEHARMAILVFLACPLHIQFLSSLFLIEPPWRITSSTKRQEVADGAGSQCLAGVNVRVLSTPGAAVEIQVIISYVRISKKLWKKIELYGDEAAVCNVSILYGN